MPIALRRLWIQMTADRKRFGVLLGALAIGALLWARIIIVSQPPRRAMADDEKKDVASNVRESKSDDANDNKGASGKTETDIQTVTLSRRLSRDPFEISEKHFPKPTIVPGETPEPPKSTQATAENVLSAEVQRTAQLSGLADRMKLEAVMRQAGLAVINGEMYRVGDSFPAGLQNGAAFTVKEVLDRSVRLECEGRMFEIRLRQ